MPASCDKASTADTTDPKFADNIVRCASELTEFNWKTVEGFIQKLPELMEKASPVAKNGGLVLLSAYVLYRSLELHDRAIYLARDYKMLRHKFESSEEKMKPVRDFMEKEFIPQWKKDNYANTQKRAQNVFKMLRESSTELEQLVQGIHQDTKNGAIDKKWSVVYGVGAVAVCVSSVFVGNIWAKVVTCLGSVGTAASCVYSYYSLDDTLIKLDMLWEDTTKMRKEVHKHCAHFEIAI